MELLNLLFRFFFAYGYYFLFLASLLENIPFIGAFTPGEVVVVAAAFFSASYDHFALWKVILVATGGGFLGNNISYFLGYRGGRPLLENVAARLRVRLERIKMAEEYFGRHGSKTVFFGRYLAGVKALIPFLAGASLMNYRQFLIYSTAGIISWTLIAAFLGYFFGNYWVLLLKIIRGFGWGILFLFMVLVAFWVWLQRRRKDESTKNS